MVVKKLMPPPGTRDSSTLDRTVKLLSFYQLKKPCLAAATYNQLSNNMTTLRLQERNVKTKPKGTLSAAAWQNRPVQLAGRSSLFPKYAALLQAGRAFNPAPASKFLAWCLFDRQGG